jgi:hypothetical protein
MSATLHDELMREAGFETDRDAERGRLRKQRRTGLLHLLGWAASIGLLLAWVEWLLGILGRLGAVHVAAPHSLLLAGTIAIGVGLAAGSLARWLTRHERRPLTGARRVASWLVGRQLVEYVVRRREGVA